MVAVYLILLKFACRCYRLNDPIFVPKRKAFDISFGGKEAYHQVAAAQLCENEIRN